MVELEGSGSSAGSTEPGDDVDGDDDDTAMFWDWEPCLCERWLMKDSNTEMMIAVSRVSLRMIKNICTEKYSSICAIVPNVSMSEWRQKEW